MALTVKVPEAAKERVDKARAMSTTEDALDEILTVAIEQNGRAPAAHFPRLFEYPWTLEYISRIKNVKTAADIGAGVSPLPLALAKRGIDVYTFDASEMVRTWEQAKDWQAWGFLDYGVKCPKIKSFNKYFSADLVPGMKYDAIYSVSVVEHTPKSARVSIWNEAAKTLSDDGRLVFTIDIVPNTNRIWNHSLGRIVEAPEIHGKISDVHQELRDAGFVVEYQEILRGIPMSRVDLLFFTAKRA